MLLADDVKQEETVVGLDADDTLTFAVGLNEIPSQVATVTGRENIVGCIVPVIDTIGDDKG